MNVLEEFNQSHRSGHEKNSLNCYHKFFLAFSMYMKFDFPFDLNNVSAYATNLTSLASMALPLSAFAAAKAVRRAGYQMFVILVSPLSLG